ncbi:MAG TPA: hypothetical protein VM580_21005 [Labilithrix sp.]|nr:hypothetical protein [Labilithrix sp.]
MLVASAPVLVACRAVLDFAPLTPLEDDGGATEPSHEGPSGQGDVDAANDGPGSDAVVSTCEADFATDPKHCGRCGHDCLGGTCEAGKCQPVKLADGLAVPEGLVVDATDVFVAEFYLSRIIKFSKGSLGPCVGAPLPNSCILTANQSEVWRPTAMGIDADNVYWANAGGNATHEIRSCPRKGCGAQSAKLVAELGYEAFGHLFGDDVLPLELVVRDGLVFWPESLGGAIRSVPTTGGAVTTYLENASFMPLAIAVDEDKIYFTDDTNQHPTRIQAVPRDGSGSDGSAVEIIAETPARPYGIGLTASGNLYWTVPFVSYDGDGLVQAAAKTGVGGGAAIGAVASSQSDPRALIVDDKNVYWLLTGNSDVATGQLVYCPLSGCPTDGPIVLASYQRVPRHLTQDEQAIYWSNEGLVTSALFDGQVWKVAKP